MSIEKNKTGILAFVPDMWSDIWQSRHHLLTGLSEYYKVLWVSPPTYWEACRNGFDRNFIIGRGVHKISDQFWTFAFRLPLDYKPQYVKRGIITHGFRSYKKICLKLYIAQIKKLLRQMGIKKVILYIWRPDFQWALGKFGEKLACYHIDDDYGFNPNHDVPASDEEMKLINKSDMVFIHSRSLIIKKGNINPRTFYVPNGVDFNRYRKVMQSHTFPPDDIAAIPKPRIGYVGFIKRHIDLPLIRTLAKTRRDLSIVLIGPTRTEHTEIAEEIEKLKMESNVYLIGGKSQVEIPYYIKALDVCLMPYRQTEYTKHIYPVKLHEYLACGKPVVAIPLDNLMDFSNIIQFAIEAPEWGDKIDQAIEGKFKLACQQQIETAKANSWQSRINLIKAQFDKV